MVEPRPGLSVEAPSYLNYQPVELRFGTSGLRGLVRDMSDLEVYINARGFLSHLLSMGELALGGEVAVAEDLRERDPSTGMSSSPRIGRAVCKAILDAGCRPIHCGCVPTPALAHFAFSGGGDPQARPMPSIMVTGSHIPADRNGVKFYRPQQEVLKSDEAGILAAVGAARAQAYALDEAASPFDATGMLRDAPEVEQAEAAAAELYSARYLSLFSGETPLAGLRVVYYQHSAVGRDLIPQLLEALGAEVFAVERSEAFISVDTEDVSAEDLARFGRLARQYGPDAILSTDGDSDRPLVIDEKGHFHRGDVLGLVCAEFLGARFCAVPVSASDAIDLRLAERAPAERFELERTRIGSPFVIDAMQAAAARMGGPVVGWESNGGFLLQTPVRLNGRRLSPLATRDAVLPMLCALLAAKQQGLPLSALFERLPQRATGAGLIDDFAPEASRAIIAAFTPEDSQITELRFAAEGVGVLRRGAAGFASAGSDEAAALRGVAATISRYFSAAAGFGSVAAVNYLDGVRVCFENGEIAHLRPSGNAPQLRIYGISAEPARTEAIVSAAISEPDGLFRRMERELLSTRRDGMAQRELNLEELRRIVASSQGPRQVLAIANGGDGPIVRERIAGQAAEIFRADGQVRVFAHEEKTRRGQLLGLLDAVRLTQGEGRAAAGVTVGIMLPGQGTRLSPLTQRLHGIKPFFPMPIRNRADGPFFSGATASLYSWTFVAYQLERMGFEGIAWKWGDEPQIAATDLGALALDLSHVDAVRFGSELVITEDLARNKEWLLRDSASGELKMQVRRRSRQELIERFGLSAEEQPRALVHIGSPALSYRFMAAAEEAFGGLAGWLDVDGYLFEALTHDEAAWAAEIKRDPGLRELLAERPDFYQRVQRLRRTLEQGRGRPLSIKVIDFGVDLYWGDVGQLLKARDAYLALTEAGAAGRFARELGAMGELRPDSHGNLLVGDASVPKDGSVRGSVVINSTIKSAGSVQRAVIVDSHLGRLEGEGVVVVGATALELKLGQGAFAFHSIGERIGVAAGQVHTTLPKNPRDHSRGLDDYTWEMSEDPGRGNAYQLPGADNPRSFAEAFALMRQREVAPERVEEAIEERYRAPLRARIGS